jgi:hypothetical protein
MLWASSVYPFETQTSHARFQSYSTAQSNLFILSFLLHTSFQLENAKHMLFLLLAELLAVNALGFQLHTSFNKKCQADRDILLQNLCRDRLKGFLVFFVFFFGYKQTQGIFFFWFGSTLLVPTLVFVWRHEQQLQRYVSSAKRQRRRK